MTKERLIRRLLNAESIINIAARDIEDIGMWLLPNDRTRSHVLRNRAMEMKAAAADLRRLQMEVENEEEETETDD